MHRRLVAYVGQPEFKAGAEISLHRALAVGGDQHVATRCRGAVFCLRQADINAERFHIVIEDSAELIVAHLANVSRGTTEIGEARNRIGHGTARHLGRRSHLVVNFVCSVPVDKRHRARFCANVAEEIRIDMGEHVDNCVADAEELN